MRIGPLPLKAKWVRVEIRKHELLPAGFPNASESWDHVGDINNLWQPPPGKEWGDLQTADFNFFLPLPEAIPPSVEVMKGGIRYELVAALCYRSKSGIFKKEAPEIIKISEQIRIVKHDLHSAWPIYNVPDTRTIQDQKQGVSLVVQRPNSAFGPSDRVLMTCTLKSSRPGPFKLKGFECHLHEIVVGLPSQPSKDGSKNKKSKQPEKAVTKSRVVIVARYPVDEVVRPGGDKSARIDMGIPVDKLVMTVKNARAMEIAYEMEVKAVMEGVPEVKVQGIKYVVGPFPKSHAQQAVKYARLNGH